MQWTWLMSDLVLVVYGITLITGLPANLLALYTFVRKVKQNPKPIDVLLLSLTISDLIFLFFLPFRMEEVANMKWTRSYFFCTLTIFVFFTGIYNSTFLLMAISVERYLGVAFPSSTSSSSILATLSYNNTHQYMSTRNSCYEDFSHEQLNVLLPFRLFLVFFCAPFIICCFCYIKFILILSRMPTINPKKRFRAIGLALVTLVVFIICFMPFSISHLVGYIGWYNPSWREYALLTSTFNACLDPFIFYFSSSALRQMFKTCARGLVKRLSFCSKAPCCTQQNRATAEEPPSTTLSFLPR
uniref:G-protein coupled receptors family 1 profile domain-containing protein n=1 Tax=Astyanax mexicanus TaxID=7994 RepID=A0A3B1IET2_ASTMX